MLVQCSVFSNKHLHDPYGNIFVVDYNLFITYLLLELYHKTGRVLEDDKLLKLVARLCKAIDEPVFM